MMGPRKATKLSRTHARIHEFDWMTTSAKSGCLRVFADLLDMSFTLVIDKLGLPRNH
jgi:uncharacterized protein YceK